MYKNQEKSYNRESKYNTFNQTLLTRKHDIETQVEGSWTTVRKMARQLRKSVFL